MYFNNSWQEETQEDTESEDEEQQIYNPLKLPMGWDGKPIPYWLYKLHGLGQVLFNSLLILESEFVIFTHLKRLGQHLCILDGQTEAIRAL